MFKPIEKKRKDTSRKCRRAVDTAYKRALLYEWFPEVKRMFAQIVIDCQTKKETVSCEYCIVKENCHLRLDLGERIRQNEPPMKLLVPPLQIAT